MNGACFSRRRWLRAASALAVPFSAPNAFALGGSPSADQASFEIVELTLPREANFARRCSVLIPRAAPLPRAFPLLVLLHGLGETTAEALGIKAWLENYGLARAWERLRHAPLEPIKGSTLATSELEQLNQSLAVQPFEGLVVACPFMPNPYGPGGPAARIRRYAGWLESSLLPAVRERTPLATKAAEHTGIAGVSLGGMVATEVFLSRPALFATLGTVQGAFDLRRASEYARRLSEIERARASGVFVSTSSFDPYRAPNERLYAELERARVPARLSLRRGAHSQAWLRDIGSLETLLWHDRALRGSMEMGDVRSP